MNSYFTTLDVKFKTNIVPIHNALDTVNSINWFEYNWKNETGLDTNIKQSGVIAQQLEEIGLGHLVDNNGHKTVNYLGIIHILIEARIK